MHITVPQMSWRAQRDQIDLGVRWPRRARSQSGVVARGWQTPEGPLARYSPSPASTFEERLTHVHFVGPTLYTEAMPSQTHEASVEEPHEERNEAAPADTAEKAGSGEH